MFKLALLTVALCASMASGGHSYSYSSPGSCENSKSEIAANGDFRCYTGEWIPAKWRCDDMKDCRGPCGEDELKVNCLSTIGPEEGTDRPSETEEGTGRSWDDGTQMVNVALAGTASQDSTGWSGAAARAIDGNTDGDYWESSCSHTSASSNTWWKVELEQEAVIDHVIVFNREDCCSDRINGAKVYVVRGTEHHLCGTIQYTAGTTRYEIGCGAEAGDAVLIKGASYLTLCEVRVMADPDEVIPPSTCEAFDCEAGKHCEVTDSVADCVLSPVATGCEENTQCGDYGECLPVGLTDFSCVCDAQYYYDDSLMTCLPSYNDWTLVRGEAASGNDAESTAECPVGTVVKRCHTFGVTSSSDGVHIREEGALCVATAKHAGEHPIHAVAYCGVSLTSTDPCTGMEIGSTEYRYNTGAAPSVQCPPGYIMSSCTYWSPWSESVLAENKASLDSIGNVEIQDNTCNMKCFEDDQNTRFWCRLTAVCTKLTGDDYMRAACPTCDDVDCGEGMVCSLTPDTILPVCTEEIEGGCDDVTKCGTGQCSVVDVTDFTCICSSGYFFNGATCQDTDECEELPCGNGECTNTEGGYTCACREGFEVYNGTCIDMDECIATGGSPCSANMQCSNIEGSYECDCLDTFYLESDGSCSCAEGFQAMSGACQDINECDDDLLNTCSDNEVCANSVGDYSCDCHPDYALSAQGLCTHYRIADCNMTAGNGHMGAGHYATFKNNNIDVKIIGAMDAVYKEYASLVWEKDGEAYTPQEAPYPLKGFMMYKFQPEMTGRYVASVYIDKPGEEMKCEVVILISLRDGNAKIDINNRKALVDGKKAGSKFAIICKVRIVNSKLENANDPHNVHWYRVIPGEDDLKLEDTAGEFSIKKWTGTYRLNFLKATHEQSGTYRCEWSHDEVHVTTEATVNIV